MRPLTWQRLLFQCSILAVILFVVVVIALRLGAVQISLYGLGHDLISVLLRQTNQPVEVAAREMIVLELYRRGAVSGGKAAELLGMSRWEFIRHASRLGIAYFAMTEAEWEGERAQSATL